MDSTNQNINLTQEESYDGKLEQYIRLLKKLKKLYKKHPAGPELNKKLCSAITPYIQHVKSIVDGRSTLSYTEEIERHALAEMHGYRYASRTGKNKTCASNIKKRKETLYKECVTWLESEPIISLQTQWYNICINPIVQAKKKSKIEKLTGPHPDKTLDQQQEIKDWIQLNKTTDKKFGVEVA